MSIKTLTGYASIDKPWLEFFSETALSAPLPECTIYEYLWQNNKGYPYEVALDYLGTKITYGKLFSSIDQTARAFAASGVKNGDIVTVALPSVPEAVYILYALSRLGAVANMIDLRSDADTLDYYLREVDSRLFVFLDTISNAVAEVMRKRTDLTYISVSPVESASTMLKLVYALKTRKAAQPPEYSIAWSEFLKNGQNAAMADLADGNDQKAVLITHTSGTTGKPKGVILSDRNINALVHQYSVGMDHHRQQKYLCVIPPFIAFGDCVAIHLPLGLGMTDILIPQFDPKRFRDYLKRYRPTHFTCTPLSLEPLIADKHNIDLSYLVTPAVGGDYMSVELEEKINQYLTSRGCRHQVIKGYGMTEVSSSACTTKDGCNKYGSVGVPLSQMSISVFEVGTDKELQYGQEGELCFSGPNVMIGYYNNPEATDAVLKRHGDGRIWMHSGDIGYITEEGFVFVIDRLKRAVTVHGNLILPSKVERVILKHPDVEKCAVTGNRNNGLTAHVVLKDTLQSDNVPLILSDLCVAELPEYAVPAVYRFRDSLPLTPVGKIDFMALDREEENA